MKLTPETAATINLGDVVNFFWIDDDGKKHDNIGVVYGNDELGIKCNREGHSYFGYGPAMFNGSLSFELLHDHAPVAIFGAYYDFVSNHQ